MDSKTEPASEAKERIEKEAVRYQVVNNIYRVGGYHGYIAGATAEHNRAQQEITRLKAELERERELRKEAVALLDVLRDDLINIHDESPTGWTIIQIDTFIEKSKN